MCALRLFQPNQSRHRCCRTRRGVLVFETFKNHFKYWMRLELKQSANLSLSHTCERGNPFECFFHFLLFFILVYRRHSHTCRLLIDSNQKDTHSQEAKHNEPKESKKPRKEERRKEPFGRLLNNRVLDFTLYNYTGTHLCGIHHAHPDPATLTHTNERESLRAGYIHRKRVWVRRIALPASRHSPYLFQWQTLVGFSSVLFFAMSTSFAAARHIQFATAEIAFQSILRKSVFVLFRAQLLMAINVNLFDWSKRRNIAPYLRSIRFLPLATVSCVIRVIYVSIRVHRANT